MDAIRLFKVRLSKHEYRAFNFELRGSNYSQYYFKKKTFLRCFMLLGASE